MKNSSFGGQFIKQYVVDAFSNKVFHGNQAAVCGSGHCHIIPYWANRLNKDELVAYQASRRGGTLFCRCDGKKIYMAGKAALFSIDELFVD